MSGVVIEVIDADWGNVDRAHIEAVCKSVTECFGPAIAERPVEPIRIEPSTLGHPRTVFARETGYVLILLSARDQRWAKYVYQFAHELCHVLANISQVRPPETDASSDWLEESLCEASSLFALQSMAKNWSAPALDDYARVQSDQGQDPDGLNLSIWLAERLPSLERNSYLRDDNTTIARALLPMFRDDPKAWCALRYLNLWPSLLFADHFNAWRAATPPQHRWVVDRIEHTLTAAH